jgi:flagellar hook-length control protein FliK
MQQVAAQKTGIAALPFATSSTAKAVETGIDGQGQSNANRAFDNLYQDARAQNTQPNNDKNASSSYKVRDSHSSSNAYEPSARAGKDRDAGHTSLPDDEKISDIPPAKEGQSNSAFQKPESRDLQDSSTPNQDATSGSGEEEPQTQQNSDEQLASQGDVEQGGETEAVYVVGEGGKKDVNAGVITTPGTPDEKVVEPSDSDKDNGEPDWVAFVERIANRQNTQAPQSDAERRLAVDGEATSAGEVREISKLWKLPDDVDADSVDSVLAHLLSQLQGKSEGQVDNNGNALEDLSGDLPEEIVNTLRSLKDLLNGHQSQNGDHANAIDTLIAEGPQDGKSSMLVSDEKLSSLISQLLNKDDANNVSATADNEKSLAQSDADGDSTLSAEEAFILSVLQQAINDEALGANEEALHSAAELAAQVPELATSSNDQGKAAPSASAATEGKTSSINTALNIGSLQEQATDLLSAIAELPAEGAQKATEAFADRIVATMPNGAQQQSVKTNIIAGINEFQQQVQQGREPGIDLAAIVADAAKEAAVSPEVAASLTARVETQASQFLQLMNNTQSSVQQVLQGQFAQVDNVMVENNQLRSEASKSQQQFEGFDKAVNIHKPEGQQQLNEKIRWMVNARNSMAEIRLDPPELGSMQVRVNVAGDAASVSFIVQSQQAKDALADAMPKLRDMLQEQGIELGDAQVRKDNSGGENGQQLADNQGNGQSGPNNRGNNDAVDDEMNDTRVIEQSVTRELKGGIDFYA